MNLEPAHTLIQGPLRINNVYKETENELVDIFDETIAKQLYEQVCRIYDKFTWNNTNSMYITNITINKIPITIEVDYILGKFRVKNQNDVLAEYDTDLNLLINNIRNITNVITVNDILNELRRL